MAEIVVPQGSNVNKGEILFRIRVKELPARKGAQVINTDEPEELLVKDNLKMNYIYHS